jgi:hypothetical protein
MGDFLGAEGLGIYGVHVPAFHYNLIVFSFRFATG